MTTQFKFTFPAVSSSQANRYAESLAQVLRDTDPAVHVERERVRNETQDFGGSLVLILGTAAVTEVAKGIAKWLARHSGAQIQISADGKVVAHNLDSNDAATIAKAFSQHRE